MKSKLYLSILLLSCAQTTWAQEQRDITFRVVSCSESEQEVYYQDRDVIKSCILAQYSLTGPYTLVGTRRLALYRNPPNANKEAQEKPILVVELPAGKERRYILLIRGGPANPTAVVLDDEPGKTPAPAIRVLNLSKTAVSMELKGNKILIEPGRDYVERFTFKERADVALTLSVPENAGRWTRIYSTVFAMGPIHKPLALIVEAPGKPEADIPNGAAVVMVNDVETPAP
jgi:hypothetical protein